MDKHSSLFLWRTVKKVIKQTAIVSVITFLSLALKTDKLE